MASGPITSWEIDGEAVETVSDFISGGSKITAHGDCSHEIKRCLLLGGKPMLKVDTKLKSRDLFAKRWTAACRSSLCFNNSQSLLKLMSIESVIPSNQLILCRPLLLLFSIFPSIRVFSNVSPLFSCQS